MEITETEPSAGRRSDALDTALRELSGLLLEEETLPATLRRVVELARRTIEGCDAAGITLLSADGRLTTAAHTNEQALEVDRRQYDAGNGPCLEALRTCEVVCVDVAEAAERYPEFAAAARAAGIRSFLAGPLLARGRSIGSLNLYSRDNRGFDRLDRSLLPLFIGQASIALANARLYDSTRRLSVQLREALTSRPVIDQAKGVLMGQKGIEADAAFDWLREESQRRNVKLRIVAEEVVRSVVDTV